ISLLVLNNDGHPMEATRFTIQIDRPRSIDNHLVSSGMMLRYANSPNAFFASSLYARAAVILQSKPPILLYPVFVVILTTHFDLALSHDTPLNPLVLSLRVAI